MILPTENEALRQANVSPDVVEALAFLLKDRPIVVAKVVSPLDLGSTGGTLISWTATNGALARGTMIRATLWGSCTVDTSDSYYLRCAPLDTSGGSYAVSARADFAPGVLANFAWQIDAAWRLSGESGLNTPAKALALNVNATERLLFSTDQDGTDSFGGGFGGIPPVLCCVASRFTAGHDLYTGKPQTFSVFFQPRNGNTTNIVCNGGFMEVF